MLKWLKRCKSDVHALFRSHEDVNNTNQSFIILPHASSFQFRQVASVRVCIRTTYFLSLHSVFDLRNRSVLQILHTGFFLPLLPSTTMRCTPSFHVCVFAAHTASGTSNTLYTSFYRYKSASPRANRVYSSNSCASARGDESDQRRRRRLHHEVGPQPRQTRSTALHRRVTQKRQRRPRDGFVVSGMSKPREGLGTTRSTFVGLALPLCLRCVATRRLDLESVALRCHR